MKTKEELNALKEEVETLNKKLAELTEEELAQVTGGLNLDPDIPGWRGIEPPVSGPPVYNPTVGPEEVFFA